MMDKSFICVNGQEIHVNTYEEIYIERYERINASIPR